MPRIPFPNIPKLPGVPAIPRSPSFPPVIQAALGVLQGALWSVLQVQTQWGIFDSKGKALADPRSFKGLTGKLLASLGTGPSMSTKAVDYSKETKVSDFPLERGGFAQYNKVEMPAAPLVTLCMGGTPADRTKFLDAINAACLSTDLFSVVTPEVTYIGYAIERYSYQRSNTRGATLLIVEISLREIRQVSAQYSVVERGPIDAPKDVGATPQIDNGKVQAAAPTKSTLKSIADKLPALGSKVSAMLQGGGG